MNLLEARRALKRGAPKQRVLAAHALRHERGAGGLGLLDLALKDPEPDVRIAAAHSLGKIGTPQAATRLVEALRESFTFKMPWLHVVGGAFVALFVLLLALVGGLLVALLSLLGLVLGLVLTVVAEDATVLFEGVPLIARFGRWGMGTVSRYFTGYFRLRHERHRVSEALATALLRIAKHSPSPQLIDCLPALKAMANDVIQDKHRRDLASQAHSLIDQVTRELERLPRAASSPRDQDKLPRASESGISSEKLPRSTS